MEYCVFMAILLIWSYPNQMFLNTSLEAYEDSTTFGFAIIGNIYGANTFVNSSIALDYPYPATTYYDFEYLGLSKTIARYVIGIIFFSS